MHRTASLPEVAKVIGVQPVIDNALHEIDPRSSGGGL
jgi:hypothetical protein